MGMREELPDIEPELRAEPPRPMVWESKRQIAKKLEKLLVEGAAVRARVVKADTGWESGYEAGPYYRIDYAWEWEGRTYKAKWSASYDGMHLAYGAGEYMAWLERTMCEGGSFTVLFDPEKPSKATIYGTLELYVRKTLLEAVEELRKCGEKEVEAKASEVFAFIIAPLGACQREWRTYYDLLAKLGMFDEKEGRVRDGVENIEVVRRQIRAGRYEEGVMEQLSELCARYRPGVWAAA
jgi:hypothetical protein